MTQKGIHQPDWIVETVLRILKEQNWEGDEHECPMCGSEILVLTFPGRQYASDGERSWLVDGAPDPAPTYIHCPKCEWGEEL